MLEELLKGTVELNNQLTLLLGKIELLQKEVLLYRACGSLKDVLLYINYLSLIIEQLKQTEEGNELLSVVMGHTQQVLKEKYPDMFDETISGMKTFSKDDLAWMEDLERRFSSSNE